MLSKSSLSLWLSCLYLYQPMLFAQQTLPKWEFGLGPSLVSYPDYPGSKEKNDLLLPFPYFTYRSKDLTIDQREVKKPLYELGPLELDLSLSISVPVSSKDNQARSGMEDLDGSIGLGPVFKYTLHRKHISELKLELPIRAILATDFKSIHQEGWVTSPGIYYYYRRNLGNHQRIKATFGTSADFATAQYNDYFYGVNPTEATTARPAYKATGGFANMSYSASINWHIGQFWIGGFYRQRDLKQAVTAASPLVETTRSETYGLVFTWNFLTSDETVNTLE